jgi:hypothetical protein
MTAISVGSCFGVSSLCSAASALSITDSAGVLEYQNKIVNMDSRKVKRSGRKAAGHLLPLMASFILWPAPNQAIYADPVAINEVLANEPGSSTKLEWVELYNADSLSLNLEGWSFVCKEDTTLFAAGTVIPANGYVVIARQLVSEPPDSVSFEGRWGDASGFWGDAPEEDFPAVQAKMSLTNSGGTISLADPDKNVQTFTWDKDCGDGVSLERVSWDGEDRFCCVSSDGSTPGRKNSVSVDYSSAIQLSIQPNPFSPDGDGLEDEAVFSFTLPAESNLTIKIYDVKGRLVRTLLKEEPRVSGELAWNGKDDDGEIVRIGVYVVWAEVSGSSRSQAKTTVVVAKKR